MKPTILVVDDDPDIRLTLRQVLLGEGFRVTQARNGLEALEVIAEDEPDLVLLDLMMPIVNGWDVHEALRKVRPDLPVIVVSAFEAPSGCVQIRKPISLERLLTLVEAVGRGAVAGGRLRRTNPRGRPPARVLRILVVDDDEATRSSLAAALSAEGYLVETAADGREALAILQRPELPDVMLLDLLLPALDGYEVARIVAEVPRYADLPVIALSGVSAPPTEGAVRFPILRKPVALDALLAAIETVSSWTNEAPTGRAEEPPLVDDDDRSRTSRELCCACGRRAATRCTGCGEAFCKRCIALGAEVDARASIGLCELCWANRDSTSE